jgi:hypothetical protein
MPTMPSSGALNMAQTTSPVSVAYALGRGLTSTISMDDSDVRSLAGVGGSGTTWSMSSLYGKSPVSISLVGFEGESPFQGYYVGVTPIYCYINLYNDGQSFGDNTPNYYGNWAYPTTSGIGSSYWVRFTRTSTSGTNGGSRASTGWLSLASGANCYSYKNTYPSIGAYTAVYTIELSTSSSGSPVVATATGVTLEAYGQDIPP